MYALVALWSFFLVTAANAQDSATCAKITAYFAQPHNEALEDRVEALSNFTDQLNGNDPSKPCPDWLIERDLWEYADKLDRLAQSLSTINPESSAGYAKRAVGAYEDYLTWFLDLADQRQDALIALLTHSDVSSKGFERTRRNWLRTRVGNVVHSLGASLVRLKQYDELLSKFVEYCDQDAETGAEIFPNEATENWYKWLSAQQDFTPTAKPEEQIVKVIAQYPACRGHWAAFKQCLDAYIKLNPSVAPEWQSVDTKISSWIAR
jgi:hypothetical protein